MDEFATSDGKYLIEYDSTTETFTTSPVKTNLSGTGKYYLRQGRVLEAIRLTSIKSEDDLRKYAISVGYKRLPYLQAEGYIEYKYGKYVLTQAGQDLLDWIKLNTWGQAS